MKKIFSLFKLKIRRRPIANASLRRRAGLTVAGLAFIAASTLAGAAPASAATANLYERYLCSNLVVNGGLASRSCHGVWAVGNPTRSLEIDVDVYTGGGSDADYRQTRVKSIRSLDGALHTLYWRCQYADNSLSAIVGTSKIGAGSGNGTYYEWGAGGYAPCNGHQVGMFASVYRDYGFVTYNSRLQWNTNGAAGGNVFGYQAGWPEQYYQ
jgi:hypothetical protein